MSILAVCVIVVSAGTNGNYAEKRDHEIAHCNGWAWDHPHKTVTTSR